MPPVDHASLMRSIATQRSLSQRDERQSLQVTVTPASDLAYSLKHVIFPRNLRRWNDIGFQVVSITVNFTENTLAITASNTKDRVFGNRSNRLRHSAASQRKELTQRLKQSKNRQDAFGRVPPYSQELSASEGNAYLSQGSS